MESFSTAAGITPEHLSYLIRSILCSLFFLWAAWNLYGVYHLFQHDPLEVFESPMILLRIMFLVSLMIVIIFVK
jgi:integrating conjugative element protein (TIGR03758 family)